MKLYAIRHGLTDLNIQGVYNGLIDEDINDIGIKQAEESRELVSNIDYGVVYSSPMLRARHTCEIVNTREVLVKYDERLRERTLGKLDGKVLEDEGFGKDLFFDYNYQSDDETFESLPMLFKRVHNFLDEVIKENKDKNVLIVAHGGILRAIHFYFDELPKYGNLSCYVPKNCQTDEYGI